MKILLKTAFIVCCTVLFFAGCDGNSGNSSSNDTGGNDNATIISDLYGSYWGNMTVSGTDYNICTDFQEGTVSLYADTVEVPSTTYSNIRYSQDNGGIWSFAGYADDDEEQAGTPLCAGVFTITDDAKTCVVTMHETGTTNTLTLGSDYNGEYNLEKHLYGSYWGNMTVSGTEYDICLDLRSEIISFWNSGDSKRYTNIAYSEGGDGTWSFAVYDDGDTDQTSTPIITGALTLTSDTEKTCVITMVTESVTTGTLTLGSDYAGQYTVLSDLYGSYWGWLNIGYTGGKGAMCLDVQEDTVWLYSVAMSHGYSIIEYIQNEDYTWSGKTYNSEGGDIRVSLTFSISGSELSCIAVVHPMNDSTSDPLILGDDYNGEYGWPEE